MYEPCATAKVGNTNATNSGNATARMMKRFQPIPSYPVTGKTTGLLKAISSRQENGNYTESSNTAIAIEPILAQAPYPL